MTTNVNLEILGLSEREQQVYISLIENQPASAHKISKGLKIPRSLVYLYLEKLIQKGLILERNGARGKVYFPVKGKELNRLFDLNITNLKNIKKVLPRLIQKSVDSDSNPSGFSVYQGKAGIKLLGDLAVNAQGEMLFLGGLSEVDKILNEEYYIKKYAKKRRKKAGNFDYMISDWTRSTVNYYYQESELFTKRRFLPEKIKANGAVAIFEDKIVIAKYKPDFIAILIEDRSLVEIFKLAYFSLWKDLEGENIPAARVL